VIQIQLIPGGGVGSTRIIQSSGNTAFDNSATTAVRRASPLPIPAEVFDHFRTFNFKFTPR